MRKTFVIAGVAVLLIVGFILINRTGKSKPNISPTYSSLPNPNTGSGLQSFGEPIDKAVQRITKKPFGIFVSPGNSPVSPERFTGYHTGVDFEIFPGEENTAVPVYTICSGPLLEKITASGYGGVAVQKCELGNQPVTVIYGHLKLSSITANLGQQLDKGENLAVLGQGYSTETGGERKHLHLGIHKGNGIDLRGYVQDPNELTNWIGLADYL